MKFASFVRTVVVVGVGLPPIAQPALGEIVHRRINATLPTRNLGSHDRVNDVHADADGDGVHVFRFHYIHGHGPTHGQVAGCANRCPNLVEFIHADDILMSTFPLEMHEPLDSAAFGADTLFGTVSFFAGFLGEIGVLAGTDGVHNAPTVGTHLIGFSALHMPVGWMRIRSSLHEPTGRYPNGFTRFRLIDIAYVSHEGGEAILAGQIPAPGAAMLLLLAGVTRSRRRRQM